jgi:4-amino-4-deoxy-L-arabinose transferase-like glycosyltransferase
MTPIYHDIYQILFSVLTIIMIYFLAKQMFSRKFALIASLLLIFNPISWFYGEIAAIYMSQAFFASLIAYTSYKVIKEIINLFISLP